MFSTNFIFISKKMLHVHRKFSVLVLSNLMEVLTNKEHDNRRNFLLRLWLVLRCCFHKLQMAEFYYEFQQIKTGFMKQLSARHILEDV